MFHSQKYIFLQSVVVIHLPFLLVKTDMKSFRKVHFYRSKPYSITWGKGIYNESFIHYSGVFITANGIIQDSAFNWILRIVTVAQIPVLDL